MSGIFGSLGGLQASEIEEIVSRLSHRGSGFLHREPRADVHLGCVSDDPVPLASTDKIGSPILVAFDGFLHNRRELAEYLGLRGDDHRTSHGDERLVLHLYRCDGPDSFDRLSGHFAVAIWDGSTERMLLARDRWGARPLFFSEVDDRQVFASEYKALLAIPRLEASIDRAALQQILCTKVSPTDACLLASARPVQPGHWLSLLGDGWEEHRYWSATVRPVERSAAEHVEIVRNTIIDATARQIAGRESLGVSLSGGLDSAVTVAAIRAAAPDVTIHTYSAGHGPEDIELLGAREVANHFGTVHREIVVRPGDISDLLEEVVWFLEDPQGREETIFHYITSREAAKDVGILMSGYGADGLFGGMPRHRLVKLAQDLAPARGALEELLSYLRTGRIPETVGGRVVALLQSRRRLLPFTSVPGSTWKPAREQLAPQGQEPLSEYLLQGLLHEPFESKIERMHTPLGVCFDSPFMDSSTMEVALQIPDRYKIRGAAQKWILREAFERDLPRSIARRRKTLQKLNKDRRFTEVLLSVSTTLELASSLESRKLTEPGHVDRLLDRGRRRPFTGTESDRLWTLMLTEIWCRLFIDNRGGPPSTFGAMGR